jgi:hypothetical protein
VKHFDLIHETFLTTGCNIKKQQQPSLLGCVWFTMDKEGWDRAILFFVVFG